MPRRVKPILTIIAAITGLFAWDGLVGFWAQEWSSASEIQIFLVAKLGGAVVLAFLLAACGWLRVVGLAGGVGLRHWPLLWPLWLDAGLSLLQGSGLTDPAALLGWLGVCGGIAFSEEVVFRGIVMTALSRGSSRRAVLVSAALFGASHLVNAVNVDVRIVLAQALGAGGLGLVLGATRIRARSLWPGLIAHACLDFFGIAAAGGVGAALAYSPGLIVYQLVLGGVAGLWGVRLLSGLERLPVPPR